MKTLITSILSILVTLGYCNIGKITGDIQSLVIILTIIGTIMLFFILGFEIVDNWDNKS